MVASEWRHGRIQALGNRAHVRLHAGRRFPGRRVEVVLVANIKNHSFENEDAAKEPGQVVEQPLGILEEHHFLAQGVEPFDIRLALFGLLRLTSRSFRHRLTTRQLATNETIATHACAPMSKKVCTGGRKK